MTNLTASRRAVVALAAALTGAASPTQGYYAGLETLYPYKPVYCDTDNDKGACYGRPGDLVSLPKSAPLPPYRTWCEWADSRDPRATVDLGNGWAGVTGEGWYQWKPRTVPPDRVKYLGEKVCYLEDRGSPKNINDLKPDAP